MIIPMAMAVVPASVNFDARDIFGAMSDCNYEYWCWLNFKVGSRLALELINHNISFCRRIVDPATLPR